MYFFLVCFFFSTIFFLLFPFLLLFVAIQVGSYPFRFTRPSVRTLPLTWNIVGFFGRCFSLYAFQFQVFAYEKMPILLISVSIRFPFRLSLVHQANKQSMCDDYEWEFNEFMYFLILLLASSSSSFRVQLIICIYNNLLIIQNPKCNWFQVVLCMRAEHISSKYALCVWWCVCWCVEEHRQRWRSTVVFVLVGSVGSVRI